MNTTTKKQQAQTICRELISTFPHKTIDEFIELVEYPAFQAKIPIKTILTVADQIYNEAKYTASPQRVGLKERIPTMTREELLETHKHMNQQYVSGVWSDYDAEAWDLLVERILATQ